jgi:excisionase family DNA binding protein
MSQIHQQLEQIITELRLVRERVSTEREILSLSQAAEYLGLSRHTIREWIQLRKIPYFKVNGTIKFRKSRLDQWIDNCEIPMRQ